MNRTPPPSPSMKGTRIAKYLADCGVASRRTAEKIIETGAVQVNGTIINTPVYFIQPNDQVRVHGTIVEPPFAPRLWCYHKPAGLITTHDDPQGRETIFDQLPEDMPRVISVGRLDLTSEGLILLTTSGALAKNLTDPQANIPRTYRVRIYGKPTDAQLEQIRNGMSIDGIQYRGIDIAMERTTANHSWVEMTLYEGKNREIRRIFEYLDMQVTRLIRTSYGPYTLGSLPVGMLKEVPVRKGRVPSSKHTNNADSAR